MVLGAGAAAQRAAPSPWPCTWHRLGAAARQSRGAGAQGHQGAQRQGCSHGDAQEGQLHTGVQQTCTGSGDSQHPARGSCSVPTPWDLPVGRREAVVTPTVVTLAVVTPTLLAALTEKFAAMLPRWT